MSMALKLVGAFLPVGPSRKDRGVIEPIGREAELNVEAIDLRHGLWQRLQFRFTSLYPDTARESEFLPTARPAIDRSRVVGPMRCQDTAAQVHELFF